MRALDFLIKEFRQLRRDKRLIPFLFLVPVFQLVLFGYVVSTDVKHVRLAACDQDRTLQSRELIRMLSSSEYFDYLGEVPNTESLGRLIESGHAAIALVIPRGFERDIRRGDTAEVQGLVDGSDANSSTVAIGYLGGAVQSRAVRLLSERLERAGIRGLASAGVEARTRVWYNPTLETKNYMVPGVLCILLANIASLLTALAIVKEREIGTIEQLIVTPVRPWELMLGKMLPFLLVGYVNTFAILIAGALIFHVPMRGSLLLLLFLAGVFLIASLGIGLLVSTVSRTQQQAMMASVFFLMPNMLLSGFAFPIENMPVVLQGITYLLPMRHFLVIARDIFLRGAGMATLWPQTLALAALATGIMTVAVLRFQKRLD